MITLVSTPAYSDPADPSVICRWLATESPNNFRLCRKDYAVLNAGGPGAVLTFEPDHTFTGVTGDSITVVDDLGNIYQGSVANIVDPDTSIETDILYDSIVGSVAWVNNLTDHPGYYFEGRLTVNGILYPLTIMASPDKTGMADLDVSGILRIVTALGKTGTYTNRIEKETTKSGKFNFEFRACWYGSDESWEGDVVTSPIVSPPLMNDWYYAECVRSEEQGSNLHDYEPNILNDAPFLNQFENPVYYLGLPFDLSFILPEQAPVSPASDITVTINIYDSNNLLLQTITETIDVDSLEGFVCSLNINQATIPTNAAFFTAEIYV